jgi:hypothetical protein
MFAIRLFLSVVLIAFCSAAVAEEAYIDRDVRAADTISELYGTGPATRSPIQITQSVRYHPNRVDLELACRSGYAVDGCTDFPFEKLECHCVPFQDGWIISISADIEAIVHLSSSAHSSKRVKTMRHELDHLEDIRSALARHLSAAGSVVYRNQMACLKMADVMSSLPYMRDLMNRIRIESNTRFRCLKPTPKPARPQPTVFGSPQFSRRDGPTGSKEPD